MPTKSTVSNKFHRALEKLAVLMPCPLTTEQTNDEDISQLNPALDNDKPGQTFPCQMCERQYGTANARDAHVLQGECNSENSAIHKCQNEHSSQHCLPQLVDCPVCGAHTESGIDLLNHVNEKHYQPLRHKPLLKCPYCSETFTSADTFTAHFMAKTNCLKLSHLCLFCLETFENAQQLTEHVTQLHPRQCCVHLYKCAYCTQTFSNITEMHDHFRAEHADVSTIYSSQLS